MQEKWRTAPGTICGIWHQLPTSLLTVCNVVKDVDFCVTNHTFNKHIICSTEMWLAAATPAPLSIFSLFIY